MLHDSVVQCWCALVHGPRMFLGSGTCIHPLRFHDTSSADCSCSLYIPLYIRDCGKAAARSHIYMTPRTLFGRYNGFLVIPDTPTHDYLKGHIHREVSSGHVIKCSDYAHAFKGLQICGHGYAVAHQSRFGPDMHGLISNLDSKSCYTIMFCAWWPIMMYMLVRDTDWAIRSWNCFHGCIVNTEYKEFVPLRKVIN